MQVSEFEQTKPPYRASADKPTGASNLVHDRLDRPLQLPFCSAHVAYIYCSHRLRELVVQATDDMCRHELGKISLSAQYSLHRLRALKME